MGKVDDVGTIVFEHTHEGQVYEVEHHEGQSNAHHQQSPHLVVVVVGNVESEGHPECKHHRDVEPAHAVVFESLLELAIPSLTRALQSEGNREDQTQGSIQSDGTEDMQAVRPGSVPPVDASREGDVEAVKQNQSHQSFLEEAESDAPHGPVLEDGRTGCKENGQGELTNHYQVHDVEVVDERGRKVHGGQDIRQRTLLTVVLEVEPVQQFQPRERGNVNIEKIMAGQIKEGQLQDTEQLEPDDFAGQ